MKKLSLLLAATIVLVGCGLENNARDSAAALNGVLTSAQAQHLAECQADPSMPHCQLIKRGISGQNALITATESYCGWSTTAPPPDPTTKCVPVKGAEAALKAAITNANELTLEIKGTVKP